MTKRKAFYLILLFIAITFSIMAPIVNHQFVPHRDDYTYHLQNILEAKQALRHGEFLLRVAPDAFQGMLYPVFQFYAPTIYTVAGIIGFISQNPLDPFKYTIGLCLILGAFYSYRLYVFLFKNEIAAVLGAILYMFSPYLLININVRGDFTEAATQGLVPVMLYYAFKLFYQPRFDKETLRLTLIAIFVFYILSTSHLITFLFSSLFMFLLFFFMSWRQKNYQPWLRVLLPFILALFLSSWYLVPVVKYEHLLNLGAHTLYFPWVTAFFTQISTLLSIKSTAIAPFLAGYDLYPGIGLPILMALMYWLYKLGAEKGQTLLQPEQAPLLKSLLWTFFIAFFIIWSPVDFWKILPREAYVVQFPYRLLTDTMWLGGLLFTACVVDFCKNKLSAAHLMVGGFLIALSGALWLNNNYSPPPIPGHEDREPVAIKTIEDLSSYFVIDYLAATDKNTVLPEYSPATNSSLLTLDKATSDCHQENMRSVCNINLTSSQAVQLPILYYPDLLQIKVDGISVPYFASNSPNGLVAAISLPAGKHVVVSRFSGLGWANVLSGTAWVIYIFAILFFWYSSRNKQKTKI